MKAKIRATGDIIEVERVIDAYGDDRYFPIPNAPGSQYYNPDELDFLPEKETVVLEGWICKDGKYFCDGGFLRLFIGSKPYRIVDEEIQSWDGEDSLRLPYILLPSVTWESEPKRVRITIEEIE